MTCLCMDFLAKLCLTEAGWETVAAVLAETSSYIGFIILVIILKY